MTQPTYRCVECSQPAPAGQLLCAACTARVEARKKPPQTPYQQASPGAPVAPPVPPIYPGAPATPPSVYPGASAVPPVAPLTGNASPATASIVRLDLQGNPLTDIPPPLSPPPAPMGGPSLPSSANVYKKGVQYGGSSTDPNVLAAQLKQAEGDTYPTNSFVERYAMRTGARLAVRLLLGGFLGILAIIWRVSGGSHPHTNTNAVSSDAYTPTSSAASRRTYNANSVATARTTLETSAAPLVSDAQSRAIQETIARINAAWNDVENTADQADAVLFRGGRPDLSPYVQQLDRDYTIIQDALPSLTPMQQNEGQSMLRAIAKARNTMMAFGAPHPPVEPPNPSAGAQGQPTAPTPAPAANGGNSAPINRGGPAEQPSAPQESGTPLPGQEPVPGGNTGAGQPTGGAPAPTAPPPGETAPPGQSGGQPTPPGTPPPAPDGNRNP